MRTDGVTGLAIAAVAILLAAWLSAASVSARLTPEAPAPDARARHATMIEQMRRDVDALMVERMNQPGWREMRQPGNLAEMEAHQRTTDRMLGRGS